MYLIRKDGLWLMGYQSTGIKEMLDGGKLTEVFTCIWGNDITGAKTWEHEVQADVYAKLFGGEVIFAPVKEDHDEVVSEDC